MSNSRKRVEYNKRFRETKNSAEPTFDTKDTIPEIDRAKLARKLLVRTRGVIVSDRYPELVAMARKALTVDDEML
jgi:hypothetical protein